DFVDADGDGVLDLVYLDTSDNSVNVIFGFDPSATTFEEVKIELHAMPTDMFGGFDHPLTVYSTESGDIWMFGSEATGTFGAMPVATLAPGLTMPLVGNFGGEQSPDILSVDESGPELVVLFDPWHRGGDHDPADDVPVPATPDLLDISDNGQFQDDDKTTLNNSRQELRLQFRVDDVVPGARVMLWIDGIRVGSTVIEDDSTSVTIVTDGFTVFRNGFRRITASMEVDGVLGHHSEALIINVFEPEVTVEPPAGDSGDGSTAQTDDEGRLSVHWGDEGEDINLHEQIPDAPPITGDVKLMHENKEGDATRPRPRRYAAGQSDTGLILFTGKDDGSWGQRNLTTEIPDAEPIIGDLDTFETPWGNLNVVGQNEDGDIVIYWQDGAADDNGDYRWNYSNISDGQLAANDQEVPAYASDIDSYITPWGGSNVVGLDDEGHIRIVWWSAESVIWISTDLTEFTESLAMVGEVSAYVTSWGGINIAGQNSEGRLVVTWWVPGGEWQVTDMGEFLSSPDLSSGSISSFITDGTLNIAGLTEEGDVIVYSWAVEDAIWSFEVLEIAEFESVTLVGRVQGYADSLGNITLFTTDLDANVHELGYDVATDAWGLVA
ncbi:MAG: hypothetical protein KDA28_05530, partial [Phycisphaerales bacterium]|nr:hypothetical protein [Phycisphaerales bacterium]